MLYLLDANVLITAHNSYYPIDRVPEFWEWLAHVCSEEHAKVPIELYEEVTDGNDALADWARDDEIRSALLLDEAVDVDLVSRVVEEGYAPDLSDDEVEKIDRDPFLISYTLVLSSHRCIVTTGSQNREEFGPIDISQMFVRRWVFNASTAFSCCAHFQDFVAEIKRYLEG